MSKEAKTKEKVDLDPKYIIKLTVTLMVACVIVAGLLGYVNSITADKIKAMKAEATKTAMLAVVEDKSAEFTKLDISDDMLAAGTKYSSEIAGVYKLSTGGYVVEVLPSGFGGAIDMVVGCDGDQNVTGISIISNAETQGVGSKVMSNQNGVLDQFVGRGIQDGEFVMKQNVNAITGATVSSKAVTRGINAALTAVANAG